MILYLSCLVLALLGLFICYRAGWDFDEFLPIGPGIILLILFGIILIIASVALVVDPIEDICEIREFRAIESSLANARLNGIDLEDAALQMKIIEANTWLASIQYWTTHPLTNWFHSKKVLELKPLQ